MHEIESAILLSRMPGVGANTFKKLIERYRVPSEALKYYSGQLNKQPQLSEQSLNKTPGYEQIERSLDALRHKKCFAWYFGHKDYPQKLTDLTEPPPIIFSSSILPDVRFAAVIGARAAVPKSLESVEDVVCELGQAGYAILSGGAAGIDGMAHEMALKNGIFSAAVLGNGVDIDYPASNSELFARLRAEGALISELLCSAPPLKGFFPARNRLIAALADLVIVIQAGKKSGTLITAKWARKLKRKLFVINPLTDDPEVWGGSQWLLRQGATGANPGKILVAAT